MRKYMNRWVILSKQVTLSTWAPKPKIKQALFHKTCAFEFRSIKKGLLGSSKKVYAREW